jgi:hypothetical protein
VPLIKKNARAAASPIMVHESVRDTSSDGLRGEAEFMKSREL